VSAPMAGPAPFAWRAEPRLVLGSLVALLGGIALFALAANEWLVDLALRRAFPPTPDPVFTTPLLDLTLRHLGDPRQWP
jgi:hypothetical protein